MLQRTIKKHEHPRPLNPRVLKFVLNYVEHGNASKAMRDAGFNPAWAGKYAPTLLKTKRVKQAVERLRIDKYTKGYVLSKYEEIAQHTDDVLDRRVAIEALKGISAIQGHNAPTRSENVNVSGSLDDLRTILGQYTQDE